MCNFERFLELELADHQAAGILVGRGEGEGEGQGATGIGFAGVIVGGDGDGAAIFWCYGDEVGVGILTGWAEGHGDPDIDIGGAGLCFTAAAGDGGQCEGSAGVIIF